MNSIGGNIGYSSIEIQSYGLPILFYNISSEKYIDSDFPLVSNYLPEIIEKIERLWKTPKALDELSKKTFSMSKEIYGISNNFELITKVFS
jgi:hypothetical protein